MLNLDELADELSDLEDKAIECGNCAHDHEGGDCGGFVDFMDQIPCECKDFVNTLDEEDTARLKELQEFDEALPYGGIRYASKNGVNLIPEGDFEDYAREYADGIMGNDIAPVSNYIDWKAYAHDMASDYSVIEFEGVTYYTQDI